MDDDEGAGLRVAQEVVEGLPSTVAGHLEVGVSPDRKQADPIVRLDRPCGKRSWSPTSASIQVSARAIVDRSVERHAQT